MGRSLGRRVWLAYVGTGATLAVARVGLMVWVRHRFESHTVTDVVSALMLALCPEGPMIGSVLWWVDLTARWYYFLFGALLTLGSFIMVTPILLLGWFVSRRRSR